jgi:hypothetical protein
MAQKAPDKGPLIRYYPNGIINDSSPHFTLVLFSDGRVREVKRPDEGSTGTVFDSFTHWYNGVVQAGILDFNNLAIATLRRLAGANTGNKSKKDAKIALVEAARAKEAAAASAAASSAAASASSDKNVIRKERIKELERLEEKRKKLELRERIRKAEAASASAAAASASASSASASAASASAASSDKNVTRKKSSKAANIKFSVNNNNNNRALRYASSIISMRPNQIELERASRAQAQAASQPFKPIQGLIFKDFLPHCEQLRQPKSSQRAIIAASELKHAHDVLEKMFSKIRSPLNVQLLSNEKLVELIDTKLQTPNKIGKLHSVEELLANKDTKYDKLRNWYKIAEFLRSYIDFNHDFKYLSQDLIITIVIEFTRTAGALSQFPPDIRKWYEKWKKIIDNSIYTASGNVNNKACCDVLSNMIDDFLIQVHDYVPWIPLKNVCIGEFPILDDEGAYDIRGLYDLLWEKGVRSCFAESVRGGFYKHLLNHNRRLSNLAPYHTIPDEPNYLINRTLLVAAWDAAPGYSGFNQNRSPVTGHEDITLFSDLMRVRVEPDNRALLFDISNSSKPVPTIRIPSVGGKAQELSKNSLLAAANIATLAAIEEDEDDYNPKTKSRPKPKKLELPSDLTFAQKHCLPFLKTWTDFVQIRRLSQHHREHPDDLIAACTLDVCCNHSFRMYGVPFVMLSSAQSVKVYCYDTWADKEYQKRIDAEKVDTACIVFSNIDRLFNIANDWFHDFYRMLMSDQEVYTDPALYFSAFNVRNMWNSIRESMEKEVQRLKDIRERVINVRKISDDDYQSIYLFPRTVDKWFSQFVSKEILITGIDETANGIRGQIELLKRCTNATEWIEHYGTISNLVDNSVSTGIDSLYNQAYRICILVTTYRERPKGSNINTLFLALRESLRLAINATYIGSRGELGASFVSPNEMVDAFLPKTYTSVNDLFTILRLAKEGRWNLPSREMIPLKSICDLINAMDVYRCVLSIPNTVELLENGLLTLWLLSDIECPNTCTGIIRKSVELLRIKPRYTTFNDLIACVNYTFISRTISIDTTALSGPPHISIPSIYYLQGNQNLLVPSYVSLVPPDFNVVRNSNNNMKTNNSQNKRSRTRKNKKQNKK